MNFNIICQTKNKKILNMVSPDIAIFPHPSLPEGAEYYYAGKMEGKEKIEDFLSNLSFEGDEFFVEEAKKYISQIKKKISSNDYFHDVLDLDTFFIRIDFATSDKIEFELDDEFKSLLKG